MAQTIITIRDDGSLKIEGPEFILKDSQGNEYNLAGRQVISLCRCGQSTNKPFCDGAHRDANFSSVCEAITLPPPKR